MTTRDAFLLDILRSPADDAPRLVFADWLDDSGELERAELIRLQCYLHSQVKADRDPDHYLPRPPAGRLTWCHGEGPYACCFPSEEYRPTWCRLHRAVAEEARLLSLHYHEWFAPRRLVPMPLDARCSLRGGLVIEMGEAAGRVALTPGPHARSEDLWCRLTPRRGFLGKAEITSRMTLDSGLLRRLFGSHPVEEVVLADRAPLVASGVACWWCEGQGADPICSLPTSVYSLLRGGQEHVARRCYRESFPGANDASAVALAACSDACVRLGQALVAMGRAAALRA